MNLKIGVKSTAILFGKYDIEIISIIAGTEYCLDWCSAVIQKISDAIRFARVIGCGCRFYLPVRTKT